MGYNILLVQVSDLISLSTFASIIVHLFWCTHFASDAHSKKGKKMAILSASATTKMRAGSMFNPATVRDDMGATEDEDMDMDIADESYRIDDDIEDSQGEPMMKSSSPEGPKHNDAGEGPAGIVDVELLDWDELGMVEQDLSESKWMAKSRPVRSSSGSSTFNLQPVISPLIRPIKSPAVGPSTPNFGSYSRHGSMSGANPPVLNIL